MLIIAADCILEELSGGGAKEEVICETKARLATKKHLEGAFWLSRHLVRASVWLGTTKWLILEI